jgi:hypothetical protein
LVLYHSSLLLLTGSTFTTFWFALLAACLALLEWPAGRPAVDYGVDGRAGQLCNLLRRLDLGRALTWNPQRGSSLRVAVGERAFSGRQALARVLLYHPTLYFAFYVLAAMPQPQHRWAAVVAFGVVGYVVLDMVRSKLAPQLGAEA